MDRRAFFIGARARERGRESHRQSSELVYGTKCHLLQSNVDSPSFTSRTTAHVTLSIRRQCKFSSPIVERVYYPHDNGEGSSFLSDLGSGYTRGGVGVGLSARAHSHVRNQEGFFRVRAAQSGDGFCPSPFLPLFLPQLQGETAALMEFCAFLLFPPYSFPPSLPGMGNKTSCALVASSQGGRGEAGLSVSRSLGRSVGRSLGTNFGS